MSEPTIAPGGPATGRRFFAVAVIAAPLVFLLSDVAYLSAGDGINNGVLGGTIGVWSCFIFGWAFIGLSGLLRPVAPRGAFALLVLGIPAACGGTAFNVNALHWDQFGNDFVETGANDSPVGLLAFLPWGWFMPASLVLIGVLVWRTRVAPAWSGGLTALGGVLFVTARPAGIDPLAIVADVVIIAGLVPLGLTMLAAARSSRDTSPAAPVAVD